VCRKSNYTVIYWQIFICIWLDNWKQAVPISEHLSDKHGFYTILFHALLTFYLKDTLEVEGRGLVGGVYILLGDNITASLLALAKDMLSNFTFRLLWWCQLHSQCTQCWGSFMCRHGDHSGHGHAFLLRI